MLKRRITILIFGVLSFGAQAQFVFDEGDIAINAGIGFISMDGVSPSLNFSAELGLFPTADVGVISIGGVMEYKYSTISSGTYYNQATLGSRIIWHMHLPFLEKIAIDLYSGVGSGIHHYRKSNSKIPTDFDRKLVPYFEYFIGSRLKLNDNLGLFAEIGGGAIAAVKGGLTYRFYSLSQKKSGLMRRTKSRRFR